MAINVANVTSQSIARFFYVRGNHYIPAALKTFNAKVIPQLFYGIPLWTGVLNKALEPVQGKFLQKILGLPNCVAYATLCLETGQSLLETRAWLKAIKYWLCIYYNYDPRSLLYMMFLESNRPLAITILEKKINSIGLSLNV